MIALSRRLGKRARVAIRVNPAAEVQGGAMRMGGKPAAFGVDEESLETVLDPILASDALEFRGMHIYIGTQILDYAILASQYAHGLEIARRVVKRAGRPLAMLDFGGGLGIPYFSHERELDLVALKPALAEIFGGVENDPAFAGTKFMVEPGRFLVGESGVYIARVIDVKVSRGKTFVICDGGMHHHLAASGNLGQTIKRNYPVAILNKLDTAPVTEAVGEVAGPLCTPLDILARNANLPAAEVGDLLARFNRARRAASPGSVSSHPTPPGSLGRARRIALDPAPWRIRRLSGGPTLRERRRHKGLALNRVLIVADHFPPIAGSSGVLRALKLCRYLPENGWQPTVLTLNPRAYERTDPSQLSDIPPDVRVIRTFALDTKRHLSIRGRYFRRMALPDRWASWVLSAVPAGLRTSAAKTSTPFSRRIPFRRQC